MYNICLSLERYLYFIELNHWRTCVRHQLREQYWKMTGDLLIREHSKLVKIEKHTGGSTRAALRQEPLYARYPRCPTLAKYPRPLLTA